ncbi:MAG: hypothetical protein ACE5JI_00460, partial [Acidobacteriota bacterium]
MTHFDEKTYLDYLEGQLAPNRRSEVEAHWQQCRRCRELRQALERETALLREALLEADEELSSSVQVAASRDLSWALLSVLGLLTTGFYVFWSSVVVPWWESLQTLGVDRETLLAVVLFRGVLWEGWSTMGERLMQWGATLLSTLMGITILRLAWRRLKTSTLVVITLAVVSVTVTAAEPAAAAVIEVEREDYVLPEGSVIDNDLIVLGRSVRIEGTIEGDLIVLAQSTTVPGHVKGDVLGLMQSLQIDGRVDGNVRTGSEFLDLKGWVGRNVTSCGESLRFHRGSVVNGSLSAGAQNVYLEGRLARDLVVGAETSDLKGSIGGSALIAAERLTIGPTAAIEGEAKYYGPRDPEVSPQASLASPIEVEILEKKPEYVSSETYVGAFLKWAAAFVFGLSVFLLVPGFSAQVTKKIDRYGLSLAVGAAALVVTPILGLAVCLTLIGAPVGLAALFAYGFAAYSAQIFVGARLGGEILGPPADRSQALGRLALGLLIIHIVYKVPFV